MKKIRSVLIAGVATAPSNMVRICEDFNLTWYHLEGHHTHTIIPSKYDAAIIIVGGGSRDLVRKVRQAYVGKPVYETMNGVSVFRHQFETDVFGERVYERISSQILRAKDQAEAIAHPPMLARQLWYLQRFFDAGDEVTRKQVFAAMKKFLDSEEIWEGNLNSAFAVICDSPAMQWVDRGRYKYKGLTADQKNYLKEFELPVYDNDEPEPTANKVVSRPAEIVIEEPRLVYSTETPENNFPKAIPPVSNQTELFNAPAIHDELKPMMDLLLETMATMQSNIASFQEQVKIIVGDIVRDIVKTEIKALTSRLDLKSTMDNLADDERSKIEGIIELLMRK